MKINPPEFVDEGCWIVLIDFKNEEDAVKWYQEQKINEQVDEALKDYESNPGCGNQCNSKPI